MERRKKGEMEQWSGESGQAAVSLVLILGLFLIGVLGFAVDLTNVWFHRQAAQTAADSACEAGAMDLMYGASGVSLSTAGFTAGTSSDCVANPLATMCVYAKENGYSGTGLSTSNASNSVSWTFPSSVANVTAWGTGKSLLKIAISENIETFFIRFVTQQASLNINVHSTCGIAAVKGAAPMMVLHPSMSGSFNYANNGGLIIAGGPNRSLQVNSTNTTAVTWQSSGIMDFSRGGPAFTGSDAGIVGGPSSPPGGSVSYNGASTGIWKSGVAPVPDPYSMVGVPTSVRSITPASGTNGTLVAYPHDGCPDTASSKGCREFAPGYYPSGINLSSSETVIFMPGIYYLNGSIKVTGGVTLRVAKPDSGYKRTDGLMFYFLSGSFQIGGNSGTPSSTINDVPVTDLTCDGSSPPEALGLGTSLAGNVLYAQCSTNGTYWDPGNDTTDTVGSPGSRGLLIFQDHANTSPPSFQGSGALAFSGALYFHSTGYADALSFGGNGSSGSFILGEIVTDQISMTGNGLVHLALSPSANLFVAKVGRFE